MDFTPRITLDEQRSRRSQAGRIEYGEIIFVEESRRENDPREHTKLHRRVTHVNNKTIIAQQRGETRESL